MNSDQNTDLLEKCDSGIKMAAQSIEFTVPYCKDAELTGILQKYSDRHTELGRQSENMLKQIGEQPQKTGAVGRAVLKMSSGMKLAADSSPANIAEFMIDGCNMGVKNLSKYINQYPGADAKSLDFASSLIRLEQSFAEELRKFL